MKKFKKIMAIGLASMATVSAMSVSAFAAFDSTDDFNATLPTGYSIDDNGKYVLDYPAVTFGSSSKPYEPHYTYILGSSQSYNPQTGYYVNHAASFSFDFSSSCTTNTKQYAEFIIGADKGVILKCSDRGTASSDNATEYVNLTFEPVGSGTSIKFSNVAVKRNSTVNLQSIGDLDSGKFYYVLLTPASSSAGHEIHGNMTLQKQ